MGVWNGTDQEAEEIFHRFFVEEYEKLIRCAGIYLRAYDQRKPINGRSEITVQEMFTLAWERRQEVLSKEKPIGWLYNALQYKVMELLREENRWAKLLLRYEQQNMKPAEEPISLEVEFAGLVPDEDLELLYRIYLYGYSYNELCQEMGLTKSALAVKVHRIKEKIKKFF